MYRRNITKYCNTYVNYLTHGDMGELNECEIANAMQATAAEMNRIVL
jgi:hypothetical protein